MHVSIKITAQMLQMTGVNPASLENKSYDDKHISHCLKFHHSHTKLFNQSLHALKNCYIPVF
jgi:hypothetical protein